MSVWRICFYLLLVIGVIAAGIALRAVTSHQAPNKNNIAAVTQKSQSTGKPSIGGIHGGEEDAIKNGQTGYLCDGNDLNSLYDTLLKILENNHYKKLGVNALEFSKNFSWNKIIKKYIKLI